MTTQKLRARYASIRRATNLLFKQRAVAPHPGFKREWENRVTLAVTFTPESNQRIWAMASGYTEETRLMCLVGDRDFPLHTTIVEGGLEEVIRPNRFPLTFNALRNALKGCLGGVEIHFNHVIHDGRGTILLASDQIPPIFANARTLAKTVFTESGFEPLRLDILHCTALRITDPEASDAKLSTIIAIQEKVNDIDRKLRKNPVVARIGGVVLAQTYQFLAEGPTSVPRPLKS